MPIEIREISIHTKIISAPVPQTVLNEKALNQLKKQLIQECFKMMKTSTINKSYFDR
jgi:hypothetical protein